MRHAVQGQGTADGLDQWIDVPLGLRIETDKLFFYPCLPAEWDTFKVHYRYREIISHITVLQRRDNSGASVTVDGVEQSGKTISLVDNRQEHTGEARIALR
jgi:cyclic beta-1,2-glucan glucanotransferase